MEIFLRLTVCLQNHKNFEEVLNNLPEVGTNSPAILPDILRPSIHPDIVYELRPNITADFANVIIKINNDGFRNKPYPREKDSGTVRIVTLGDSHMFGWGVAENKKYTDLLENMLNSRFPTKKWEVINTAVPGYNTFIEVETLAKKGLSFNPDIVLIEYINNDLDLPNFLMDRPDLLNCRESFLYTFLKGRLSTLKTPFILTNSPSFLEDEKYLRFAGYYHAGLVPEKYKHMAGWESCCSAISRLKDMQEKHDFDVLICISHNNPASIPEKITETCSNLGFHAFTCLQWDKPDFWLSAEDRHPSEKGHQIIAETIFNLMAKEKLMGKHLSRE